MHESRLFFQSSKTSKEILFLFHQYDWPAIVDVLVRDWRQLKSSSIMKWSWRSVRMLGSIFVQCSKSVEVELDTHLLLFSRREIYVWIWYYSFLFVFISINHNLVIISNKITMKIRVVCIKKKIFKYYTRVRFYVIRLYLNNKEGKFYAKFNNLSVPVHQILILIVKWVVF